MAPRSRAAIKQAGKRKGASTGGAAEPAAKKAKGANAAPVVERGPTGKPKRRPDQPKKVKLRDQKLIPVPTTAFAQEGQGSDSDDSEFDVGGDEGMEYLQSAAGFLGDIDAKALSRSVKETNRLHNLSKSKEPLPRKRKASPVGSVATVSTLDEQDLSDFDSDIEMNTTDAEGSGSDGSGSDESDSELKAGYDFVSESDSEAEDVQRRSKKKAQREDGAEEADYETRARARWQKPKETDDDTVEVSHLPIKLPSGEIQHVKGTTKLPAPAKKPVKPESDSEEEEEEEDEDEESGDEVNKMASVKGRFGRLGVADIVAGPPYKTREKLAIAKEQIARVGAEILAGGELIDNAPLLTRMSTFALPKVPNPEEGEPPLAVPASIRGLAFLSQLAVYKDLIPGYRIRELTALEQAEKVRDEVRRLREGEKLLVKSYKSYLKMLETEIKQKTALASVSLKCMCELLTAAPHFNFSENIMGVIIARLGRRSWEADSELVSKTIISVFKADIGAQHSQTLVRLLARMIKERKFMVHPNALAPLLHLRLRSELDTTEKTKRKGKGKARDDIKFKSEKRKEWMTKNMKKAMKEKKEIEKDLDEAAAEVDVEERASIQTETLKNLFVLYFLILKNPTRSPLLPAALEGLARFAHLVNIDFFRDLLLVLKKIIKDEGDDEDEYNVHDVAIAGRRVRLRLLGIVTAFELLSGQGEALNIDLNDFMNQLYVLLSPLSFDTNIEEIPVNSVGRRGKAPTPTLGLVSNPLKGKNVHQSTTADLVFRCLQAIFFSKHASTASSPPWRAAAFAKRLLECALHLPAPTAIRALDFVRQLMVREPKLESMLSTEDRTQDGVYKPELEDPQLCNPFAASFWELEILIKGHYDPSVRREAKRIAEARFVL